MYVIRCLKYRWCRMKMPKYEDLIDGDDLVDMLKKLRLGVNVRMVEEVEVDNQWFEKI